MKGEIVRVITEDGLYLEGILCEPASQRRDIALVHCHGFGGSFCSQPFLDHIADDVTGRGFTFLSFNSRGHASLAVLFKQEPAGQGESLQGAVIERFEESPLDFRAWLDFIAARGYKTLALQGHSAGSIKAARYQALTQDERIKTVIFLSPPDILGLQKAQEQVWLDNLKTAQQMVAEGRGDEIMPGDAFAYPIGARAFLSYLRPDSPAFVFNFSEPDARSETLAALQQPVLGVIGTVEEPIVGDPYECMQALKDKAVNASFCDTAVIEGASHSYYQREHLLAQTIGDWLDRVFGREPVGQ
jgi:pimeloyl-ACP methyl ester carboxylesterase